MATIAITAVISRLDIEWICSLNKNILSFLLAKDEEK